MNGETTKALKPSQPPTPPITREIETQFNALGISTNQLGKTIEILKERLKPVLIEKKLRELPPSPAPDTKEQPLCPLSMSIREQKRRIRVGIKNLENILDSLAL